MFWFSGMQSALLMFPINMVVKSIFQNSKTRHGHLVYNCGIDTVKMHLFIQSESECSPPPQPHIENPLLMLSESLHRKKKPKAIKVKDGLLKKIQKGGLYLPWWSDYVAWVLAFIIVLVSAFFTILYSFNYGLEVSVKWLSTLVLSFATDAFLLQPLQVFFIALIMSLLCKKTMGSTVEKDVHYIKKKRGGIKKNMLNGKLVVEVNKYLVNAFNCHSLCVLGQFDTYTLILITYAE